jgi:hypothetical protein
MKTSERYTVIEHLALFPDELPNTPEEILLIAEDDGAVFLFAERLHDLVGNRGEVRLGPRQVFTQSIRSDYLVQLSSDVALLALSNEYTSIITPVGRVFDAGDELLHVYHDRIVPLTSEVQVDLLCQLHGEDVSDITNELHCHLLQWIANQYMESQAIRDVTFCRAFISSVNALEGHAITWPDMERAAEKALTAFYCQAHLAKYL